MGRGTKAVAGVVRATRAPRGLTGRAVLTTGQIARACDVAPRTVSKWIDGGRLSGYRLPGSQDRRVYTDDLVAFLRRHRMRIPPELGGGDRRVCVQVPGLPAGPGAVSAVEAGALAARGELAAVLVGCADGLDVAVEVCRALKAINPDVRVGLVLAEDRTPGHVPAGVADAVYPSLAAAGELLALPAKGGAA